MQCPQEMLIIVNNTSVDLIHIIAKFHHIGEKISIMKININRNGKKMGKHS